jgi:OOP family OmpA-OmpF porin
LLFIAGCASQSEPPAPAPVPAPVVPAPAPVAQPAPPPAPPAPPASAAAPAPKTVSEKVTMAADTLFDFDKAVIRPDAQSKLDDLVAKSRAVTLEVIIVVGHTDAVGSDDYNQKLSVRRANAVKAFLVGKGVPAGRVYTEGKGESKPIADNKTQDGRAKNRRGEIEIVGTRTVQK